MKLYLNLITKMVGTKADMDKRYSPEAWTKGFIKEYLITDDSLLVKNIYPSKLIQKDS